MKINEIRVKSMLSKTSLPGLDYSLNPYRGCAHGCVYCLHPDTMVLTQGGFVKIRDVQTSVVSHMGRFCKTNNKFEHYYSGKLVDLKPLYFENLQLTPDHKVLSIKRDMLACRISRRIMCLPDRKKLFLSSGKWISCKECKVKRKPKLIWTKAVDLQKGDFIVIPIPSEVRDVQSLRVSEVLSEHRRKHKKNRKLPLEKIEKIFELRSGGCSYRGIARKLGTSGTAVKDYLHGRSKDFEYEIGIEEREGNVRFKGGKTEIPNEIIVDCDFLRLVGYYLAEGCVSVSSQRPNSAYIAFTFHEDEKEYIFDVANLIKKIFKIEPSIFHTKKDKSIRISVGANILAFIFATLFGKKSEEMKIPAEFFYLPPEKQRALMKGLLRGDGGFSSSPKWPMYVTASRDLLNSVRLILLRLGIICCTQTFRKGQKRKHVAFALSPAGQFGQRFADLFGIEGEFDNPRNLYSGIYEEGGHRYALVPIKSKEMRDYLGPVNNLSVEKDNSYVANFVAVSNCYSPAVLRETRPWGQFVDVKVNAAEVLKKEIKKKPRGVVGVATVIDPYQPLEAKLELTRKCIEILSKHDFPVSIQTKSSLVLRDADLIVPKKFDVGVTITTMDRELASKIEPRASPPDARAQVLDEFSSRGVDTWVFLGPIIPEMNDGEESIRQIVEVARRTKSRLLYDKLNLKRWVLERLAPVIEQGKPGLAGRLPSLTSADSEWWRKTCSTVESICKELGVQYEPAFPT